MSKYIELIIALKTCDSSTYLLNLLLNDDKGIVRTTDLLQGNPETLILVPKEFRIYCDSPIEYGRKLSDVFFQSQRVIDAFNQAVLLADGDPLHLRLDLNEAQELHCFYWETLCKPGTNDPYSIDGNFPFSRMVNGKESNHRRIPVQNQLKAVEFIASLDEPKESMFQSKEVFETPGIVKKSLRNLVGWEIVKRFDNKDATINNFIKLFDPSDIYFTDFDVLYFIAHGGVKFQEKTFHILFDAEGKPNHFESVPVKYLLAKITSDPSKGKKSSDFHAPLLAILISCFMGSSHLDETGETIKALGPQLSAFKTPCVLAMQGAVKFNTIDTFLPKFFQELWKDGQIDHAINAARRHTFANSPDWWMPVLFSRLNGNRLFEIPKKFTILKKENYEPETEIIPQGKFIYGNNSVHELDIFRIGKYPVLNREFYYFMEDCLKKSDTNYVPASNHWKGFYLPEKFFDYPVSGVNFNMAVKYCEWLSEKTKRHYCIPSEDHWEKAARGADGRIYPWGNAIDEYPGDLNTELPTMAKKYHNESIYGCFDMVGNLKEWTSSTWGRNKDKPSEKNCFGHAEELTGMSVDPLVYMVLRGGKSSCPEEVTTTSRFCALPGHNRYCGKYKIGFRVAII